MLLLFKGRKRGFSLSFVGFVAAYIVVFRESAIFFRRTLVYNGEYIL